MTADFDAAAADASLHELLPELEQEAEAQAAELLRLLAAGADDGERCDRVVVELHSGVGGEEAALWTQELLRMLLRYCERMQLTCEELALSASKGGGIKDCALAVSGSDAYAKLRFEAGVHRVQRVSPTDSKGRVHTSAAAISVIPEPEERAFEIADDDLRIEAFSAGGNGGQHRDRSYTAIRITHLPTGISVSVQERSQSRNKEQAMRILRARLAARKAAEDQAELAAERRGQVGSGDRSEKSRTYNFPDGRVTDHRAEITVYRLEQILAGDLSSLHEPLRLREIFER